MILSRLNDDNFDLMEQYKEMNDLLLTFVDEDKILGLIEDISSLNFTIAEVKRQYETAKYDYEIQLLEKKYSDEYEKYGSIKEKEERAKLEVLPKKELIVDYEHQLDLLKANLEETKRLLKLAYIIYGKQDD